MPNININKCVRHRHKSWAQINGFRRWRWAVYKAVVMWFASPINLKLLTVNSFDLFSGKHASFLFVDCTKVFWSNSNFPLSVCGLIHGKSYFCCGILINFPFARVVGSRNHIKTPFNSNFVVSGNEHFNFATFPRNAFESNEFKTSGKNQWFPWTCSYVILSLCPFTTWQISKRVSHVPPDSQVSKILIDYFKLRQQPRRLVF